MPGRTLTYSAITYKFPHKHVQQNNKLWYDILEFSFKCSEFCVWDHFGNVADQ